MAKQRRDNQPTDGGLSGTGGCCPLCGRALKAVDSPDAACGLCSEESIERVLAPFLVLQHKQNTESEKEVHHTKAVLYRRGHDPEKDPAWVEVRRAAKSRWPDLDAVDDAVVIATRISNWIKDQRASVPELQRPLVPVASVIELLSSVSHPNRDETPDSKLKQPGQSSIHDFHAEPPPKFREGKHDNGNPFGAVNGTKTALGFSLHYDDGMTDQGYRKWLSSRIDDGEVWVRRTRKPGEFMMYLQSKPEANRCKERLSNCAKLRETARNSTKLK